MKPAEFYGYTTVHYSAAYFKCYKEDGGSFWPSNRDAWLKHYWSGKPSSTDELIIRLKKIRIWGDGGRNKESYITVTDEQLLGICDLEKNLDTFDPNAALKKLIECKIKQFKQISFGTKLLMFMRPDRFVVLDNKIAKAMKTNPFRNECGSFDGHFLSAFAIIHQKAKQLPEPDPKISLSEDWIGVYSDWCKLCKATADRWNVSSNTERWLASDVERYVFASLERR